MTSVSWDWNDASCRCLNPPHEEKHQLSQRRRAFFYFLLQGQKQTKILHQKKEILLFHLRFSSRLLVALKYYVMKRFVSCLRPVLQLFQLRVMEVIAWRSQSLWYDGELSRKS